MRIREIIITIAGVYLLLLFATGVIVAALPRNHKRETVAHGPALARTAIAATVISVAAKGFFWFSGYGWRAGMLSTQAAIGLFTLLYFAIPAAGATLCLVAAIRQHSRRRIFVCFWLNTSFLPGGLFWFLMLYID